MSLRFVPASREFTASPRGPALRLYEQALDQYHRYVGDPIATIDQALADSPDFVLGHAFRALVLMTFGERRFAEQARVSVTSAEALLRRASDRERFRGGPAATRCARQGP